MTGVIGWYAHHVGAGHIARAGLVASLMRTPVVILSSTPRPDDWPADRWVDLPLDDSPEGRDHDAGGVLHWAPLGHRGYGERMALIAAWVGSARPRLMVSDVSVEVTLLVRALGVPVATVVMAGDRRDRPHQLAYDAASWLFAAWPAAVQPVLGWHSDWTAKTIYLQGFSRFDALVASPAPGERRVAALWGRGGSSVGPLDFAAAAVATPAWSWVVCQEDDPTLLWEILQSSDVVVCHAGQNVLAEVAAARRPAVVIPEARPHDEQHHLVRALASLGLGHGLTGWPIATDWPQLLAHATPVAPADWSRWSDGHGAERFGAILDQLAAQGAA